MPGSPSSPLQTAIYSRLSTDVTLLALCANIYDIPPDNAPFPRITFGEQVGVPNDTMGKTGRDQTVTIHSWTRGDRTRKNVQLIQNRIDALLDRWAVTVAGWSATEMLNDGEETFLDEDGLTQHCVARYAVHVYAT